MFIKKKLSLLITVVFTLTMIFSQSVFAADNTDPFAKMATVKSMQTSGDYKINISGSNFSKDEQELATILPLLSNMDVKVDGSVIKADENSEKAYAKVSTSIMMQPVDMEVWLDGTNLTSATPSIKEIMKMPAMLKTQMQSAGIKDYIVIDTTDAAKQAKAAGVPSVDMTKYTELSKQMGQILMSFANDMKDKFNVLADKGATKVTTPNGSVDAHAFEIKLDDTSFKAMVKYAIDNLSKNKDFMSLVQQVISTSETKENAADVNKAVQEAMTQLPQILTALNDVKLIDDKGVTYDFAVDKDGYVVSTSGSINIVLDAAKLSKIFGQLDNKVAADVKDKAKTNISVPDMTSLTGVYKFAIDFTNVNYNINGDVKITEPTLTKDNTTTMDDLMKLSAPATDTNKAPTDSKTKASGSKVKKAAPAKKAPAKKAPAKKAPAKKASKKK